MKKQIIFPFLFLLPVLALVADEPVGSLNGAFRQVRHKYGTMTDWQDRDSIQVIKVFRDGYWLGAFFDDCRQGASAGKPAGVRPFNGACGGTYSLRDGKYIETVAFYSWDSTAVGNRFSFNYKISPTHYEQYGKMTSEQYKDFPINELAERITAAEPLKNSALEGVWFMNEGYWGGKSRFGEGQYKNSRVVKIFAYPMVVYAYYDPTTRQFQGAGGARYQFDGTTLTETNEFWSWQADGSRKGKVEKFKVSVQDGRFVQEGWEGKLREVFAKAQ